MKQEILDKINKIAEAKNKYLELVSEHGKSIIGMAAADLLEAFPAVQAIGWTQYTPYFNDGGPFEFRAREMQIQFTKEYWESLSEAEKECFYERNSDFREVSRYSLGKLTAAGHWLELMKVAEALNDFGDTRNELDDQLQEMFGDDQMVIVSRDGIETESYEHD